MRCRADHSSVSQLSQLLFRDLLAGIDPLLQHTDQAVGGKFKKAVHDRLLCIRVHGPDQIQPILVEQLEKTVQKICRSIVPEQQLAKGGMFPDIINNRRQYRQQRITVKGMAILVDGLF